MARSADPGWLLGVTEEGLAALGPDAEIEIALEASIESRVAAVKLLAIGADAPGLAGRPQRGTWPKPPSCWKRWRGGGCSWMARRRTPAIRSLSGRLSPRQPTAGPVGCRGS